MSDLRPLRSRTAANATTDRDEGPNDKKTKRVFEIDLHFFEIPGLQGGYDMYCTTCSIEIRKCTLRKAIACDQGHAVKLRDKTDGLYFLCSRCDVVISKEFQFCYRCKRRNTEYTFLARQEKEAREDIWCKEQVQKGGPRSTLEPSAGAPPIRAIATTGVGQPAPSRINGVPYFQSGADLYCTHCSTNIPVMLLDRPSVLACMHTPLLFARKVDGIYRMCTVCLAIISDDMRFCYRCSFENESFKPNIRRLYSNRLMDKYKAKLLESQQQFDVCAQDPSDCISLSQELDAFAEEIDFPLTPTKQSEGYSIASATSPDRDSTMNDNDDEVASTSHPDNSIESEQIGNALEFSQSSQ